MTTDEFLAWEAEQPEKYELHCGEIFPHEIYNRVGARRTHAIVSGNCFAALKAHLRGSPCRAFINDIKLAVAENSTFYPDVFVTCDAGDLSADLVMNHPKAITTRRAAASKYSAARLTMTGCSWSAIARAAWCSPVSILCCLRMPFSRIFKR